MSNVNATSSSSEAPSTVSKGSEVAKAVRRESDRPAAQRERQKNFGGPRLKLSVIGDIPGFHLYWENDDEGAIEQLLYEGFEFVDPAEVQMVSHIVADKDVSNRVSRYVGKKADGTPLRAYLMKCSDETWAERESDRYLQADMKDDAIRSNRVMNDPSSYVPKGVSSSINTSYRKEY